VRVVITIKNGRNVGPGVEGTVVVDIVGLRLGIGHLDYSQALDFERQVVHLALQRFDGHGSVVENVDAEFLSGVHNLVEQVVDSIHDDVLFVRQIGDDDDV